MWGHHWTYWKIFIRGGCYDEFVVNFDGTTSCVEYEAVIVRNVTKYCNIIELIVYCGFYKKKLTSGYISVHIIDCILERCGLRLKNWLSTHQYISMVNKAVINTIKRKIQTTVQKIISNDKILNNSGKKTLIYGGEEVHVKIFCKVC